MLRQMIIWWGICGLLSWPAVAPAPPPTEAAPITILEWDGELLPCGFFHPEGIATDGWGNVYVSDQGEHHVLKFRADGTYVYAWGGLGSAPGQFAEPFGIVCDGQGFVFVVDAGNGRIQKFTDTGDYVLSWSAATGGGDPWLFQWPRGIAVDAAGQVYVTDAYYDGVFKFTSEGEYLDSWGGSGPNPGYFDYPWGLEVDHLGRVLVADSDNQRINLYELDGTYLAEWSGFPFDFDEPIDVAFDGLGYAYILDRPARKLVKAHHSGIYITEVGGFDEPGAVAAFGRGSVYVANTAHNSIIKLGYPPQPVSVVDVPDDQGRWVRLTWKRSYLDRIEWPMVVTGYGVYRRQDGKAVPLRHAFDAKGTLLESVAGSMGGMLVKANTGAEGDKGVEGWDVIATVPARGDSLYQLVAPTLCDSSAAGGVCWSAFVVSAFTDHGEFFDAAADSGYSVDNIPPPALAAPDVDEVPGALQIAVVWQASAAPDLGYYGVYRGVTPSFMPGDPHSPYATVTSPHYDDTAVQPGEVWYYRVAAFDDADNVSGYSDAAGTQVLTGLDDPDTPTPYVLQGNVPNPFNPVTTIRYDLPEPCCVTLQVHDVSGRLARVLRAAVQESAGRHEVVWDGKDEEGRSVASGAYYCRLIAGPFGETRRMLLLK
jgi:hypothetical protein